MSGSWKYKISALEEKSLLREDEYLRKGPSQCPSIMNHTHIKSFTIFHPECLEHLFLCFICLNSKPE
jgi:hypothetical protein